jgi:hypothetical protein
MPFSIDLAARRRLYPPIAVEANPGKTSSKALAAAARRMRANGVGAAHGDMISIIAMSQA